MWVTRQRALAAYRLRCNLVPRSLPDRTSSFDGQLPGKMAGYIRLIAGLQFAALPAKYLQFNRATLSIRCKPVVGRWLAEIPQIKPTVQTCLGRAVLGSVSAALR